MWWKFFQTESLHYCKAAYKSGLNSAQVQPKCSPCVAQVQPKCGPKVAQIWNVNTLARVFSRESSEEVWGKENPWSLFNILSTFWKYSVIFSVKRETIFLDFFKNHQLPLNTSYLFLMCNHETNRKTILLS